MRAYTRRILELLVYPYCTIVTQPALYPQTGPILGARSGFPSNGIPLPTYICIYIYIVRVLMVVQTEVFSRCNILMVCT